MIKKRISSILIAFIMIISAFCNSFTSRAESVGKTVKFFVQLYGDASFAYGIPMEYTANDGNNGTLTVKQPCKVSSNYNFSAAQNYNKISVYEKDSFLYDISKAIYPDRAATSIFLQNPNKNKPNTLKYIVFNDNNFTAYNSNDLVAEVTKICGSYNPTTIRSDIDNGIAWSDSSGVHVTNVSIYSSDGVVDGVKNENRRNFYDELHRLYYAENSYYLYKDVSAFYPFDFYDNRINTALDYAFNIGNEPGKGAAPCVINCDNGISNWESFRTTNSTGVGNNKLAEVHTGDYGYFYANGMYCEENKEICRLYPYYGDKNKTYLTVPDGYNINVNSIMNNADSLFNVGRNGDKSNLYSFDLFGDDADYYYADGYVVEDDPYNLGISKVENDESSTSKIIAVVNPDRKTVLYNDSYEKPYITIRENILPKDVTVNIDTSNYSFDVKTPEIVWNIEKEKEFKNNYSALLKESSAEGYTFVGYYKDLSLNSDGSINFSKKDKITSLKDVINIKKNKSITIYPGFIKKTISEKALADAKKTASKAQNEFSDEITNNENNFSEDDKKTVEEAKGAFEKAVDDVNGIKADEAEDSANDKINALKEAIAALRSALETAKKNTSISNPPTVEQKTEDNKDNKTPAASEPPVTNTKTSTQATTQSTTAQQTTTTDGKSPVANQVKKAPILKIKGFKLVKSKKKTTAKWAKVKGVAKYQVQISTSKKFTKKATKTYSAKTNSFVLNKGIKQGKTYFVRVRTVSKVDGKVVYGKWSAVRKFKK